MKIQNYQNHSQVVVGYHLVGGLSAIILFIWAFVNVIRDFNSLNLFLVLFSFSFSFITFYARSFAAGNQDRIIRMEMRYRFYFLTNKRFELFENKLTIKQIVALRFAGDDELEPLIERAIEENLTPKAIKMAIKNWQADFQRI